MQGLIILPPPVTDHEDMALRKEHKDLIATEVRTQLSEAIDAFRPHGWGKLVHVLRELGPIIGTLAAVLALIAIVVTLGIFSASRLREEAEFRGSTRERLTAIEASLLALRTAQTASSPTDPRNIQEAKRILAQAKAAQINMPLDVVENAGAKFLEASQKNSNAWNAALAFLAETLAIPS